jgi:CHAT domain-containing protein
MSLWRVGDEATRDLMVDYYSRLGEKRGTAEALRVVQLAMLEGRYPDPVHWAAFIAAGDWGSLRLH